MENNSHDGASVEADSARRVEQIADEDMRDKRIEAMGHPLQDPHHRQIP